MTETFRSLLPPSAVRPERSQEQATTESILTLDADMVRKVKNPDTCPLHLLPWLAWEFAVDFWQDDWSEEQKRQILRDAAYVHQHRGRRGSVAGAQCGWCSGSNQRVVAGFTAQNRTLFVWSCFCGKGLTVCFTVGSGRWSLRPRIYAAV